MPTTYDLVREARAAGSTFQVHRCGNDELELAMPWPHDAGNGVAAGAVLYFGRDGSYPGGAARFNRPSVVLFVRTAQGERRTPRIRLNMGQARKMLRMTIAEVVTAFKPRFALLIRGD